MANINFHPAIGLGDLLPGWYSVPQNPVQMAQNGISKTPSLGDIIQTQGFTVPQNPVMQVVSGKVTKLGTSDGIGCGCGGKCGGCSGKVNGHDAGLAGISDDFSAITSKIGTGDFSGAFSSLGTLLAEPVAAVGGLPLWGVLIGTYFAFNLVMGHEVTVGRRTRRA